MARALTALETLRTAGGVMPETVIEGTDVRPEDALRSYLHARRRGESQQAAVWEAVAAGAPEAPLWAQTDNWEGAYRATAAQVRAEDDRLRPDVLLDDLLARREQIVDITRSLYDVCTVQGPDRVKAVREYVYFSKELDEVNDRLQAQIARMPTQFSDNSALPRWKKLRAELMADFRAAYKGKGPQYELLIDRLVAAVLLQRQIEAAPASIVPGEYVKLSQAVVLITNQLQKFTEVSKSMAVREEVQETLLAFMRIVEGHLLELPTKWQEIVEDVVRRAGGAVDGGSLLRDPSEDADEGE